MDGYLVDYEPPIQIKTELSSNGIAWKVGEEIKTYKPGSSQIDLFTAPDEIKIEVEDFNCKVITEAFNRVVCDYLAQELDPAFRIVGYIRQAVIGDALLPYSERVDHALQKLLASKAWTGPQRDWLKRIAAQTKANILVDREALDDPNLLFRRDGGGFDRLDKLFDGQLLQVLDNFNETLWQNNAA